jgi:hypothetical protein
MVNHCKTVLQLTPLAICHSLFFIENVGRIPFISKSVTPFAVFIGQYFVRKCQRDKLWCRSVQKMSEAKRFDKE